MEEEFFPRPFSCIISSLVPLMLGTSACLQELKAKHTALQALQSKLSDAEDHVAEFKSMLGPENPTTRQAVEVSVS